jgi:uncharacterized membrane protein (DUF485 family)
MTLHHGPAAPAETENPHDSAWRARLGVWLFFAYLTFYAAFVLINAFAPHWMAVQPAANINLAIWFGLGLIVAAGAIALIYAWLCRAGSASRPEEP